MPDTAPDTIALPQLSAHLRAIGVQPVPTYSQVYRAIIDGAVPAERRGGKLYLASSDLPRLAEVLGFKLPRSAA